MNKYQRFVERAVQCAKKSPMEVKYGAVLIYNGKVVSEGFNCYSNKFTLNKYCVLCN